MIKVIDFPCTSGKSIFPDKSKQKQKTYFLWSVNLDELIHKSQIKPFLNRYHEGRKNMAAIKHDFANSQLQKVHLHSTLTVTHLPYLMGLNT